MEQMTSNGISYFYCLNTRSLNNDVTLLSIMVNLLEASEIIYGKCSKISKSFHFLFLNKLMVCVGWNL